MEGSIVGKNATIHAGSVVGGDGFGFHPTDHGIEKMTQRGHVVIEEHVEMGPLATVDRATFDSTRIGRGSKLDSHVHIGHNVQIGENSILCGQVGISGSAHIGKNFIAAGKAGVTPGIHISDNVTLGAKTGVIKNIERSGNYMGFPAQPSFQWRQMVALLKRLPATYKTLTKIQNILTLISEKVFNQKEHH